MNLTVQARETKGKGSNKRLRNRGQTPGIVYGGENLRVLMNHDKAIRIVNSLRGTKKVFELEVESEGKTESKKVVIQDYQFSKVGRKLLHVDFFEVSDNTMLTTEIPILVVNEEDCPALKEGGVMQIVRRSVPVSCKAMNVPASIEIDVENLQFGESIHVLDIEYPEGVKPIVRDRNFTLITVVGKMAEEEEVEKEEIEEEIEGAEAEKAESEGTKRDDRTKSE